MLGPNRHKFSVWDDGHTGVVYSEFGEDRSETLPIRLFFLYIYIYIYIAILGGGGSFPARVTP